MFGALKGRFQSLRELRIQIQTQKDFDFANSWLQCCFILHNLIVEIEEKERQPSTVGWARKENGDSDSVEDEDEEIGEGDQSDYGSDGQKFRSQLMQFLGQSS